MPPPDQDPHLTSLQLDVMRVLWARGEATATEVHADLAPGRRLAPTTVATLLRRLERRGLLAHRTEGRQFVYRPAVSEDAVRSSMVGEVISAQVPPVRRRITPPSPTAYAVSPSGVQTPRSQAAVPETSAAQAPV